MPGEISKRAVQYRGQADQFRRLAEMEQEPRVRARFLEIANDYQHLADTGPRKPSAELLGTRAGNNKADLAVSGTELMLGHASIPSRQDGKAYQ